MPRYEIETHGQLDLSREWLLTNSIGGFSSSTIVGCNTRRYHGLLCAATKPPVGRYLALSRLGEVIYLDGNGSRLLELGVNQFGENLHPRGDRFLQKFSVNDVARWEFSVEGVRIIKTVKLVQLKNEVEIRYAIVPDRGRLVEMRIGAFVAMRDFHSLRRAGNHLPFTCNEAQVTVEQDEFRLHIEGVGARFVRSPDWWLNHRYQVETQRGQDDCEDLFTPGYFTLQTREQAEVVIRARLDPPVREEPPLSAPKIETKSEVIAKLVHASKDFIVRRRTPKGEVGTSIIAGYPWFADWGRDTMISLPGLLLCTKRFEEAKQVLSVFASYVSEGMIPNRFDDYTSEPHYNTVDASLWFIHACFEYLKASEDRGTFDHVLKPACQQIIAGYRNGTRYHIKMDERDGLISQGGEHTQLTWMDAKFGDHAFTPRQGKAVEINALWYHALKLMGEEKLAEKVKENFQKAYWISPFRGLYDVVDGERKDAAIRPNQIFAVSLANSPLTNDQQHAVVEVVRRELLTPMGLRSLAKGDPNYHGKYEGDQWHRDEAYHNGVVWSWPIGAFIEAHLRANYFSAAAIEQGKQWLAPLIGHLNEACIGQISEIFEGDPPHRPCGCFAQAWGVAEVLRAAMMLGM